jgi:hypothetical protein
MRLAGLFTGSSVAAAASRIVALADRKDESFILNLQVWNANLVESMY